MSERILPVRLDPVAGESFRSYVDRLASLYEVPLADLLAHIGILESVKSRDIPGFGVKLDPERTARFCRATGLEPDVVRSMQLEHYDGFALDLSKAGWEDRKLLPQAARENWVYFKGSHFCPGCLRDDDGAWQLAWKLPWSFACTRHRCLLVDTCPVCKERAGGLRAKSSMFPVFASYRRHPGTCGNAQPVGRASPGRSAVPCGFSLMESSTLDLSCEYRLLDSQARLNQILSSPVRGDEARVYLSDLRALTALTLFCSHPDDLGDLPHEARAAFVAYAEARDEIERERHALAAGRKGSRVRTYMGAPKSTALLAAVIPAALEAIEADSELPPQHVRALAAHMIARRRDSWAILSQFACSPRLQTLFRKAVVPSVKFDRGAGARSGVGETPDQTYDVHPRHVPQLFPEKEFEQYFARHFPRIGSRHARRFCSMALVKLCAPGTWRETAASLGLPVSAATGMANRAIVVLKNCGAYESFARDLHAAAARRAEQPVTDYRHLRAVFAGFVDIPANDWRDMCKAANVPPGIRGGRSRYAAAWLWADLTGGDWTLAPALANTGLRKQRLVFQRLNKSVLPALAPFLQAYGSRILSQMPTAVMD